MVASLVSGRWHREVVVVSFASGREYLEGSIGKWE